MRRDIPTAMFAFGLVGATALASPASRAENASPWLARPLVLAAISSRARVATANFELLKPNPILLGAGCLTVLGSDSPPRLVESPRSDRAARPWSMAFASSNASSLDVSALFRMLPIPAPRLLLAAKSAEPLTVEIAPTTIGSATGIAAYGTF